MIPDYDLHTVLEANRRRDKWRTTTMAPKMLCGSFYIPKRKPERPLGEDSHFVCEAEQAFGVADGVGGWARKGIDSGVYARQLMLNSAASVRLDNRADVEIDPMSVLRVAYASTTARGSSTACIAVLNGNRLSVANLGDSGFWIFRDNKCACISPIQQHHFNCPYQLGRSEGSDRPSEAVEMDCIVEPGDIIVLGTDGLLDNVYPSEIECFLQSMEEEETELDAELMAQQIAEMALENSVDAHFCSPFQLNAEKAGLGDLTGGKIDDFTVIVALIY